MKMDNDQRQALHLQRDLLRKKMDKEVERLSSGREAADLTSTEPAISPMLDDRQIETLALRAVTRFAALEPAEADRMWKQWDLELSRRFPPLLAEELRKKADGLRERAAG